MKQKAERSGQPQVQVVAPNGGESLYLGAMDTISWNGMGLAGALVKLELLVGGAVAGTIVENLPGTQTSYQWQVGKTLTGTVNPGTDCKVRVMAVVPMITSGATYYFYDSGGKLLSEYDSTGACVKDYLYLGGKMIGEYVPATSNYYYYASDQINSTRLVTDATGAVVHSAQYDPYGGLYKTWVDTYHPKPGFSGKEREFGSEMDYFGARYYGHRHYRFFSVDPILGKEETITNPQLWNLYAYCRNNPVTFLDPDGNEDENSKQDNDTRVSSSDDMPKPPGGNEKWKFKPNKNYNPDDPNQRPGSYIDPSGKKWQWDPDPNRKHPDPETGRSTPHWDIDPPKGEHQRVLPDGSPITWRQAIKLAIIPAAIYFSYKIVRTTAAFVFTTPIGGLLSFILP